MHGEQLAAAIAAASQANPMLREVFPVMEDARVLHVDGDYLAYYCSGNDETTPGTARLNATHCVGMMQLRTGSRHVVMDLSSRHCTKAGRYSIATQQPYQGQRGGHKPKNWEYLRDFLEGYTGSLFMPRLWHDREADDAIAFAAARADIAIATRDKDMRFLPGLHINWCTHQLTRVPRSAHRPDTAAWDIQGADGKQYGLKWFYLQLLTGDAADNIPGLPRLNGKACGPKRAGAYLAGADRESAFRLICTAYGEHYGSAWADALMEQAALLWLRNDEAASTHNVIRAFPADTDLTLALARLLRRLADAPAHPR